MNSFEENEKKIREAKKEKDEKTACKVAMAFMLPFQIAMLIQDIPLITITVVTFIALLIMSSKQEKIEKELEKEQYQRRLREYIDSLPCESVEETGTRNEIKIIKGGKAA